ncbi:hypothetical protein AB0H60_00295 [Nocardia rhamnosiphila]|uniref:hypothetical protein n=1 Tax=Nocardia rhamnosiphila TaxID=426716 RepID=UPI0033C0A391
MIRATDLITATAECDMPATALASSIVVMRARTRVPRSVVAGQESRLRERETAARDGPDRAGIGVDSVVRQQQFGGGLHLAGGVAVQGPDHSPQASDRRNDHTA